MKNSAVANLFTVDDNNLIDVLVRSFDVVFFVLTIKISVAETPEYFYNIFFLMTMGYAFFYSARH